MRKILLIGSRQNKFDSNDTGGVTILFELLISELKKSNIEFTVIDTLKANHKNIFIMYISLIWKLIKYTKQYDHISLHATKTSFIMLAPIMIIISKIFSKPTSIRKFAGNFDAIHKNANFFKKSLINFVLKNTNYLFFETKYLVEYFKLYNSNTFWFPNVRDISIKNHKPRSFQKRFVYIGSINEEKGIDELCEAIQKLDDEIICDLYGPFKYRNEKYSVEYFKKIGVNYMGALNAEEVQSVLDGYDVLLLPSHQEGYPGIIIEAFALGIPVIATKLEGIMEMCEDGKNSILIDVKQPEQLLNAIIEVDKQKYITLHTGAVDAFSNFNSHIQTNLYLERINYKIKERNDV